MSAKRSLVFLSLIFILGLFLRLYLLSSTMPFIGDQAWFFLSARDALLTGRFPLLGITSSVTWLHQGSLYTYLLIPELALSHFHPVSGAIFTAFLSAVTIILCYFLGRIWFDSRGGLTAAFIFATSPLAIIHARMPYHTSPIPFFMALLLLFLSRRKYFISFLVLGLLYQLELVTVVLWPVFIFFLVKNRYSPRFRDFMAFAVGILPFLLSGPVSTVGVFVWTAYHWLTAASTGPATVPFYLVLLQHFFLPGLPALAAVILLVSVLFALWRKKSELLWLLLPLVVIFFNKTTSEAYFSLLLLPLALFSGYFLSRLFVKNTLFILFLGWWLVNIHYLLIRDYALDPGSYGAGLSSRLAVSDAILAASATSVPRLTAVGPGSQFATTVDPYRYLIWWRGLTRPPGGKYLNFVIDDAAQTWRVLQ